MDIKSPLSSPLYSMHAGLVYSSGISSTLGNYVIIRSSVNGESIYILYGHLQSVNVFNGSWVGQGGQLGLTGNTGNAVGSVPHVHIQVRTAVPNKVFNDWDTHDPEPYLGTKFDVNGNPINNDSCSI